MKTRFILALAATTALTATAATAQTVGRIIPNLPKDLKTTCRVTAQEGSGFSTYSTMKIGDTLALDLTRATLTGTIRFNQGAVGDFYLPLQKPLRLTFSEWNEHVYGAIYRQGGAQDAGEVQMFVELAEEGDTDQWAPIVTLQQRVVYGWKWLPPATAVLKCDARVPGQNH